MYEIVFLIDTNLAACSGWEHCNEVLITVYRILSSFLRNRNNNNKQPFLGKVFQFNDSSNNKSKRSDQAHNTSDVYMKWGCKFFNTCRTIARNRTSCSSSFKKFKLCHLEDFERKLVEIFSAEKDDITAKSKNKSKRLLHPAELLSAALTETLHDFKWTAYDALTSPVNHRRNITKSSETSLFMLRYIFVLTKIPCSKKSLRCFANKMVPDSDVFIDSIMSPALLHEYQQKMKISLNCVDFSSDGCSSVNSLAQDVSTAEELFILKDAFRKLGGCFISKDVVLCSVPETSDCAQDSDLSLDSIRIFSSFSSESLLSRFQEVKQTVSHGIEFVARLSCKSFQSLPVNLIPVTNQDQGSKQNVMDAAFQSCKPLLYNEADGKGRKESSYQKPLFTQQPMDFTDIHFTLLGCIPHTIACHLVKSCLQTSFMFSCGEGSLVSSLFQQLTVSENVGLLGITARGKPSLTIALLQAQSGDFGFITMLSLEANLKVEKALLQHYEATFIDKEKLELEAVDKQNYIPPRLGLMEKLHDDIQKLKSFGKTAPPVLKNVVGSHIFQSHCLNSWHVPGSTSQMSTLISKINDRLAVVDSKVEKEFLKQLQRYYMKERQPPEIIQNLQPPTNTPNCGFRQLSVGSSGESESSSRSSHDGLRSSTLSRGRLMVNRARSANFTTTEDENESLQSRPGSPERRRSNSVGFVDIGLATLDDLKTYLQQQYDQALNAGVAIETTIKTMVKVTSQFMSKTQPDNSKKSTINCIKDCIALSSSKLREKFNKEGTDENKNNRVNEYKLQIMLLLEMECFLNEVDTSTEHSQVLSELVSMLRALSFLTGATHLTSFLMDIVTSYLATLPQLLVNIFDELMLRLPPALTKFASPTTPSSLFGTHLSVTNDSSIMSAPGSSQPPSNLSEHSSQQAKRFHKFKQHPSISDFRQKKQILVKPKIKVEIKKQVKDKVKTRSSSSRVGHRVDCERAKRNLFSEKTKHGNSKTKDKPRGHHRHRHSRPKTSRTLVLGTPVHKQTSQRHLRQQERQRQRENIQPVVQVIAESPMKDDDDDDDNNGISENSTLNRPARYIVREAFYSSNTQPSRSLARSLELAEKGDGQGNFLQRCMIQSSKSQGTLASAVRGESPILSPKSRLLKAFLFSPSPRPKSRQKHKSSATTPLRRSPRKSAKKLVFKDSDKKIKPGASKTVDTDYAHLIFDGENANDFDLLVSSAVGSAKRHFHGGYKTPEKQVIHSQSFNSEAASCPPVLVNTFSTNSAQNLSFRNILSNKDKKNSKKSVNLCTGSSEDISTQPPVIRSPSKQVFESSLLSLSDLAPRLSSSILLKSPTVKNSFSNFSQGETCASDLGKYVYTTPKKHSFNIHTTPSKVKFLESCLISPPTGSGHPPSLEKSTPGKSILKNSPIFKGKAKRRIELQPVSSCPLMKNTISTSKCIEPSAYSDPETKLNSSIHLLGKMYEVRQICVPKPDSKSCSNNEYQNVENKIPPSPYCRMTQRTIDSHKQALTNLYDPDSVAQNSQSKGLIHKMNFSEDISCNSYPKKPDLPAAVTICTLSSGSKPKADTINKWVRLKRSSPKNGTNPSSRLALSPAYPSSSNDAKFKASRTEAHFSYLESGNDKNVNEDLGVKMHLKKRSLHFEDDSSTLLSPSKRRKSESRLGNLWL